MISFGDDMINRLYITTPIYYVNSYPHLGHLYSTLVCDSIARYRRQRGFEVFFLTGTDEHGINIERAAAARGLEPKQHVDEMAGEFRAMVKHFGLEPDYFIRTSDDYHKRGVQELWRRWHDAGYLYKGFYEGWFCAPCAAFKTEDEYIRPQNSADPPLCLVHERPLDRVSEESYFFKLSQFQSRLLELYDQRPDFIRPPARRNEIISFVRGGLQDLSVSRTTVRWGVPVPDDPAHTMYVWMDALCNYITALGFGNDGEHLRNRADARELYQKFWPESLHLIGKDIIRFHAVYWPAFLMAAGLEPPRGVYAHGYWLSGGRRTSKTLGNVIDLDVLHKHFANDMVRYFCLREMVFGQDSDFTYGSLIDRTNADLADGLGNLFSRTMSMIQRYCDGIIPAAEQPMPDDTARNLLRRIEEKAQKFVLEVDQFNFSRGLEAAWSLIAETDKYISDSRPWDLAKRPEDRTRLTNLLNTVIRSLRALTVLLHSVIPDSTREMARVLNLTEPVESQDPGRISANDDLKGRAITSFSALFPKIDKERLMSEISSSDNRTPPSAAPDELSSERPAAPHEPAPRREYITIDDFAKVELRAGTVLTAEKVERADKLMRMTIDLGEAEPRQVVAGIAPHYSPEQLIGRRVVVVSNLMPRKLRGHESNGMILAASVGDEGRPVLAGFLEDVPNGTRLK